MAKPYRCPVCGGEGKIPVPESAAMHKPCHACSGTGIVWEPKPGCSCSYDHDKHWKEVWKREMDY